MSDSLCIESPVLNKVPTVLIGVCGCIAAYKACELVRLFQMSGWRVKVVMTENATQFVGPATFRALTKEPVALDMFSKPSDPIYHISLAKEADAFLIAPATANVIAKLAHGIADDLLTTTALACSCPIFVAPAMNTAMYEADATQDNLSVLKRRAIHIIEPEEGALACGDVGIGRLAEPSFIVENVLSRFSCKHDLAGKTVLITAGPTREAIDPVRYISNNSSGLMGYALAEVAYARGARVHLISGPVSIEAPEGPSFYSVCSAREMFEVADALFKQCDIAVFCAAVCDMRPVSVSAHKLKKSADLSALAEIHLEQNPDILSILAHAKSSQLVVGFAAETENLIVNARAKLQEKNADLIVANLVGENLAFGKDEMEVFLVDRFGVHTVGQLSKNRIAHEIFDHVLRLSEGFESVCQ